jgi:hypothetical protein
MELTGLLTNGICETLRQHHKFTASVALVACGGGAGVGFNHQAKIRSAVNIQFLTTFLGVSVCSLR